MNVNYVEEVCVRASCGQFEITDSSLTGAISAHYALSDNLDLYGKIENVTGEEDIMSRQPYGARPNKDTTASFGVRLAF
jgi:Fe(3+) dicitrate transport protein